MICEIKNVYILLKDSIVIKKLERVTYLIKNVNFLKIKFLKPNLRERIN